ncbi:MAG: amino acid synthesis family protein [Pseudomonadota bacterium]|nr:amino acid synthesis family protein [Pseudomonadota bacterium]MEC8461812.1 amino acid synthesis family protein [Pseudomonadota bacterium]MEC8725080.1 amino acid synthesis family protein [Pseudomonadota bacterium]
MTVRRLYTVVEETLHDRGQIRDEPLRKVAVVAVINNPFAGHGYVEDLSALTDASVELGTKIAEMGASQMAPYTVDSYGKAALIGTAGEQEHGVACLTTVYGNVLRDAVGGGKAWISSMTKRVRPGEHVDIPLAHKDALFVRSHYDGMTIMVPDAPLEDEICVICCFANRGRLNHRVGGPSKEDIVGNDGLR